MSDSQHEWEGSRGRRRNTEGVVDGELKFRSNASVRLVSAQRLVLVHSKI